MSVKVLKMLVKARKTSSASRLDLEGRKLSRDIGSRLLRSGDIVVI